MTTLLLVPSVERLDSRGRKIGRNWWREYNTTALRDYNDSVDCIAGTNHQMEPDEFRSAYPLVNLKQLLIGNAGMRHEPEADQVA